MLYLQIYCIKNKHFSNRNVMLYMIIVPHMQVHIDLLKHTHTQKKKQKLHKSQQASGMLLRSGSRTPT